MVLVVVAVLVGGSTGAAGADEKGGTAGANQDNLKPLYKQKKTKSELRTWEQSRITLNHYHTQKKTQLFKSWSSSGTGAQELAG